MSHRIATFALIILTACTAAPQVPSEVPPPIADKKQEELRLIEADKVRLEFPRILLQIDHALESYTHALADNGKSRSDLEVAKLDKLLRQYVNGERDQSGNVRQPNKQRFMTMATDGSDTINQGIALTALGFAEGSDVMPVILQGAQLSDQDLVDRAVLGLTILKDPRTPPGVVIRVMEDPKHNEDGRLQAAWALTVLQEQSYHEDEILVTWRRTLTNSSTVHPLVLVSALRGIGLTRKATDAAAVVPFLKHPVPKVRVAAAVALGRMNAQDNWQDLLELIGPSETVLNVRLAARKSLQALAGGDDRGYDQSLWRRQFDRSGPKPAVVEPAKK
ncbi:hypothetical protein LBMAG49_26940 [Planctomycetota bacterium]|nr:hypothetical protein LBMAG49_26940 [Planctomycetota bacterium]